MKLLVYLTLVVSLFTSCTNTDNEKKIEKEKIAVSVKPQQALNELCIASNNDIEALSKILNTTPSTINRVLNKETLPTKKFENKIDEVYSYYTQNNISFSRLRYDFDKDFTWINYYWDNIIIIVTAMVLKSIIGIIIAIILGIYFGGWDAVVGMLIFIIVIIVISGIMSLITSNPPLEDVYIQKINPELEIKVLNN